MTDRAKPAEADRRTSMLTINAMLAALSAVLGYFSISTGNFKFTFEGFPVLLAALMYGPVSGALVGGVGIFIYQVLRYGFMITTPLWVLPYMAEGLIAGFYAKNHNYSNTNSELCLIIFLSGIAVTVTNSFMIYIDSVIYGYYSWAYVMGMVPTRFIVSLIKSAVYSAAVPRILKKMSRITHNGR